MSILLLVIGFVFIISNFSIGQRSDVIEFHELLNDYHIVTLNASYVEIEYKPRYTGLLTFNNSAPAFTEPGFPDLRTKIFPVFLPADQNNRIELVDYRYEDLQNIDVPPAAKMIKGKEPIGYDFSYEKNNEVFSKITFIPVLTF